ncbi:protein FAR1-RELATED SEQUENCE 5-like [Beta vulgaris subsp. vulgaris]|uniref:protein FAR1-RELATED SEQUENCE 5-like n=1 Tax=Beta vulgaris subsp. vulgaris TaxID=3555 RepID=UPI002036C2C8|nr:protein FAR1-RELATED SEQUENCE 5-like [Beta vulgaris subsp. vulgaris]
MESKAPSRILTDQAAAMRKALAIEMLESRHRWCIWHITSKIGEKLGKKKQYAKLKSALLCAIYESLTTEEFESNWDLVIESYELQQNTWLKGLYKEREMWVYIKHLFWAGMKTTQRVESIHSFFDDYVKKHTRLYEFAETYCKAMENRAEDERRYDAYCETCVRQIVTGFPAEYVFQKCYTDMKFKKDRVWSLNKDTRKEFLTQHETCYAVKFDSSTKLAFCECCLFENSGIMCRHIINLYSNLGISGVPQHYILRRWRKDVQRKHTRVKVAYHDPSKNVQVKAFNYLQLVFEPICAKAVLHKHTVDLVIELLQLMDIRVDEKCTMIAAELLSQTLASVGNRTEGCTPHSTTGVDANVKSTGTSQPLKQTAADDDGPNTGVPMLTRNGRKAKIFAANVQSAELRSRSIAEERSPKH